MPCSCHGKSGKVVNGKMPADEPCTACALKHVTMAQTAWGEFTYQEDNRQWVSSHLRLACEHLKTEHRETALQLRDIAVSIEMAEEKTSAEIRDRLANAVTACRALFNADHSEVMDRLQKMKAESPCDGTPAVDMIIPLADEGSGNDSAELKILLRSVQTNCRNLGRIYVVTHRLPSFVNRETVTWVDLKDELRKNKDGNIIWKILTAVRQFGIGRFVFAADDNVFLQPCDLGKIPVLHSGRPRSENSLGSNRWWERRERTFAWLESRGVIMDYDFEPHVPQLYDGAALTEAMKQVPYYVEGEGVNVGTIFRGVLNQTDGLPCMDFKETATDYETGCSTPLEKLFLGYTDAGFQGLKDRLLARFPDVSQYEKNEE